MNSLSFFQTSKSKILTFPERKSDIIYANRQKQHPLFLSKFPNGNFCLLHIKRNFSFGLQTRFNK